MRPASHFRFSVVLTRVRARPMIIPISNFINLYVFTPGRRVYALRRLREIAIARGVDDLVPAIDEALAHEAHTAALESAWGVTQAEVETRPREIDPQIDRNLLLIDQILRHYADQGGEVGRYAGALVAALFPHGVSHHIRLPYIDQLAANERVLSTLEAAERQTWVERLGLRMLVASLRELNEVFGHALRLREQEAAVTFADVRAARERGQALLLEIVARVLGRFPTAADAETRTALLQPIADQNEEIRLYRRRRRRVVDIDPSTGEPTEPIADDGDLADDELVAAPDDVLDPGAAPADLA